MILLISKSANDNVLEMLNNLHTEINIHIQNRIADEEIKKLADKNIEAILIWEETEEKLIFYNKYAKEIALKIGTEMESEIKYEEIFDSIGKPVLRFCMLSNRELGTKLTDIFVNIFKLEKIKKEEIF